jgi:hypothetical protein
MSTDEVPWFIGFVGLVELVGSDYDGSFERPVYTPKPAAPPQTSHKPNFISANKSSPHSPRINEKMSGVSQKRTHTQKPPMSPKKGLKRTTRTAIPAMIPISSHMLLNSSFQLRHQLPSETNKPDKPCKLNQPNEPNEPNRPNDPMDTQPLPQIGNFDLVFI